jgi:transposase InsO family protein
MSKTRDKFSPEVRERAVRMVAMNYTQRLAEAHLVPSVGSVGDSYDNALAETIIDAMQKRLDLLPNAMGIRRRTVEHVFGTLKSWMGSTHFLTKTLKNVRTEMSLCVLAYNMKRMIQIMGVQPLIAAIWT